MLLPEKRLVGRAFTVQFMPTRPDVAEAAQKIANENGVGALRNQTAIDMLQAGDVAVVDLFGKIEGGTFVGDKLAYYVQQDHRNRPGRRWRALLSEPHPADGHARVLPRHASGLA